MTHIFKDFKVGDMVFVNHRSDFSRGSIGTITELDHDRKRLWVKRGGSGSNMFFYPQELDIIKQEETNMKYLKSGSSGSVFKLIHKGENYAFGSMINKPDTLDYSGIFRDKGYTWVDPEINVGDMVKSNDYLGLDDSMRYEVIAIDNEAYNPWVVLKKKDKNVPFVSTPSYYEKVF